MQHGLKLATLRQRLSLLLAVITFALPAGQVMAQPQPGYIDVRVVPDKAGWTYELGERAVFEISVLRAGYPVEDLDAQYTLGPELMEATDSGTLTLKNGRATVKGGTMKQPGFIRMEVTVEYEGKTYRGTGTAGFAPDQIEPAAKLPDDFMDFWEAAIAEAREIPLDPVMTLLPEYSTTEVNVYHVSFQNDDNRSRIYGMLSMPAAPGKYPVILQVPGAGVRPYSPNVGAAQRGVIHLAIGIHGIPVNMDQRVYNDLRFGALDGYWTFGIGNRDSYYYRRVILGAVRAGDFLQSLPEADSENYGVYGSSQGGALSIITAALDKRVTRLSAIHPAMSDHEAFLQGRAGGWPRLLSEWYPHHQTEEIINNVRYYDVVNFARHVTAPGLYTWGFNDSVCPPTSMYAAYNVIPGEKELWVIHETAHWTYPEQWERSLYSLVEAFGR